MKGIFAERPKPLPWDADAEAEYERTLGFVRAERVAIVGAMLRARAERLAREAEHGRVHSTSVYGAAKELRARDEI